MYILTRILEKCFKETHTSLNKNIIICKLRWRVGDAHYSYYFLPPKDESKVRAWRTLPLFSSSFSTKTQIVSEDVWTNSYSRKHLIFVMFNMRVATRNLCAKNNISKQKLTFHLVYSSGIFQPYKHSNKSSLSIFLETTFFGCIYGDNAYISCITNLRKWHSPLDLFPPEFKNTLCNISDVRLIRYFLLGLAPHHYCMKCKDFFSLYVVFFKYIFWTKNKNHAGT